MFRKSVLFCLTLILLQVADLTFGLNYIFVPETDELFSKCEERPEYGYMDILADLSALSRIGSNGGTNISGNITMKWDVQPLDRVAVEVGILKFEKGAWKPTILKGSDRDFCKSFYDKNTIYYPYSTEHVVNKEQVKDKCINIPGTVLVVEPFYQKIVLSYALPLSPGLHKAYVIFSAFDKAGVKRPNEVCLQIVGNIVNE
ncbi:uncharacterized protein LOC108098495 [Drosophila ficusphila]|uniref:uncharacterized protein LOC108098495 n=1 Tax=Drosophila ficusphila TaxID=30025 RepID=UPI0007E8B589|nr:uncharacterized protein LOC108098495 [Drosophila ficusphila]